MHIGNLFYTEPAMRLARAAVARSLGGSVFFSNSGAEANEAALKLARKAQAAAATIVVRRSGAFHGRTYGALSATPQESKQAPFAPLVPGFRAVPRDDPAALDAAVDERHRGGAARADPGRDGHHAAVRRDAARRARGLRPRRRGARSSTRSRRGMGRTGTLWAYEQTGRRARRADDRQGARRRPADRRAGHRRRGWPTCSQPGDHGSTFAGGPRRGRGGARRAGRASTTRRCSPRSSSWASGCATGSASCPACDRVRGRGLMHRRSRSTTRPRSSRRALLEQRLIAQRHRPDDDPPAAAADRDSEEIHDALERIGRLLRATSRNLPDRL